MRSRSIFRPKSVAVAAFASLALSGSVVSPVEAQMPQIRIVEDGSGHRLQVDGEDLMVLGVNWDYFPIGTTYNYDFWNQSDDFIQAALDREMALIRGMGGNAIRVYVGIKPRWVRYIYEQYGIWTVLNHALGRYGTTVDGVYYENTDYSNESQRAQLIGEVTSMVQEFEGTPGVLMWLLGNENNYGLVWNSAETEALPEGERDAVRARYMYSLFQDATEVIKGIDTARPVAMANGDLQYIDIIAEELTDLDVFGSNVYRGASFRDLFEEVDEKLGVPVMFTEFGADRFDAVNYREDQVTQARYLIAQWQEIYENAAGKGLVGNSIGGLTFQWSDGWWKFGQEDRLDIQDINASWPNDAYPEDYREGDNNMNEEWWGIMAKGQPDARGLYDLYPRAAYYALRDAYELDPYSSSTDLRTIRSHFEAIDPNTMALSAGGEQAGGLGDAFRLSGVRMELETYSTGGAWITTPEKEQPGVSARPSFQGFDHKESFYTDLAFEPQANLQANLSVNILGNVPNNPIDEIFYENRGRSRTIDTETGAIQLQDIERLKVYGASLTWDDRWFTLDAFYRTGHYHWAYEGDFFNMYREANYGPNLDIYNGEAPLGFEFSGKKTLDGFKLAVGPELWWGANPAIIGKYTFDVGGITTTAMYQEDLDQRSGLNSSFAIPTPQNRRASLHAAYQMGDVLIDVGGLWSGNNRVGRTFQIADPLQGGGYRVLQDEVKRSDQWGGKAKLTFQRGRVNWYVQGAAMGLVSDGGWDQTQTFTGYALKDTGIGNQWNVLSGLALTYGNWQIAPNFLYQKPIVGPVPSDAPAPGRPRNILDDPFAVRVNRETRGAEMVLTYDPTPATWMYQWDNDVREDARFAASFGGWYKAHSTTQDAAIGILADGRTAFAFPGAAPARDLWEVRARLVSKLSPRFGVVTNLFFGRGEPNGGTVPTDPAFANLSRSLQRFGGDARIISNQFKFQAGAKFDDWGPYDYHRDFNLTFPMQLMGDVSYVLGMPEWFDVPMTRFGVRAVYRTLDEFSNRYCPDRIPDASGTPVCDASLPGPTGTEWEIRTYIHIGM